MGLIDSEMGLDGSMRIRLIKEKDIFAGVSNVKKSVRVNSFEKLSLTIAESSHEEKFNINFEKVGMALDKGPLIPG